MRAAAAEARGSKEQGNQEGDESSGVAASTRHGQGTHQNEHWEPPRSHLYWEGWDPTAAKETARLQDLAGLTDTGPNCKFQQRFTLDSISRKNLLEMKSILLSCLTPFMQAPLLKEQRESVWFGKPRTPSLWPRKLLWGLG